LLKIPDKKRNGRKIMLIEAIVIKETCF